MAIEPNRMSRLARFAYDDPFAAKLNTPIGQVKSGLQATPVKYRMTGGDRIRSGARSVGKYLGSDQFSEGVAKVTPYISNLAGAFRQAPMPPTPINESPIQASTVRYDAARAGIDNATVGADRAAGRYLSGQAAGAVMAANQANRLGAYSNVAMEEANQNAQIRNYNAAQNAQITGRNVERANNYNEQVLARNIAQQRTQSENLANFADKSVQENARKDMMSLDKEKFDILSRMYSSGILDRNLKGITIPGTDEKIGGKKAMGGSLRPKASEITRFRNLKPVYK